MSECLINMWRWSVCVTSAARWSFKDASNSQVPAQVCPHPHPHPRPPVFIMHCLKDADWEVWEMSAQEDEVHVHHPLRQHTALQSPSQDVCTITPKPPGDSVPLKMNAPGSCLVCMHLCFLFFFFCLSERKKRKGSQQQHKVSQMQIHHSKSKAHQNGELYHLYILQLPHIFHKLRGRLPSFPAIAYRFKKKKRCEVRKKWKKSRRVSLQAGRTFSLIRK